MNAKGQTLLQTVFALAILSVVGAGAVLMIRHSQLEVAMFATKQGHIKLQQDLKMSLGRSIICRSILHGTFDPGATQNLISIDWSTMNAQVTLASGVELPGYGVRVNSVGFLMTPPPVLRGRLRSGADLYVGSINLASDSFPSGRGFGDVHIGPLYFEVLGGAVTNCFGEDDIESVTQATCEAMGGDLTGGRCRLPAKLADISCETGHALHSFDLRASRPGGCVDLRP